MEGVFQKCLAMNSQCYVKKVKQTHRDCPIFETRDPNSQPTATEQPLAEVLELRGDRPPPGLESEGTACPQRKPDAQVEGSMALGTVSLPLAQPSRWEPGRTCSPGLVRCLWNRRLG